MAFSMNGTNSGMNGQFAQVSVSLGDTNLLTEYNYRETE